MSQKLDSRTINKFQKLRDGKKEKNNYVTNVLNGKYNENPRTFRIDSAQECRSAVRDSTEGLHVMTRALVCDKSDQASYVFERTSYWTQPCCTITCGPVLSYQAGRRWSGESLSRVVSKH